MFKNYILKTSTIWSSTETIIADKWACSTSAHGTQLNTSMCCLGSRDRIITIRLPVGMIHLDVCDGVPRVNQGEPVWARGFVGTAEGFGFPVCPVDVVLKQCQCNHPWDVLVRDWKERDPQINAHPWETAS